MLAPTVAWMALRRVPARALGLGGEATFVRVVRVVGALVAGAGAFWLLAAGVEAWLEHLWPTPPAVQKALRDLVMPPTGARPLALDLATLALVPACAEELLFRGVLFGALRPRLGTTGAVVACAVAFGLYHASPYRFVPALFGGVLLGVVRAGAGLGPAIAFHFANNAGVIVALHLGYETPPARSAALVLACAALCIGCALALLPRRGARE